MGVNGIKRENSGNLRAFWISIAKRFACTMAVKRNPWYRLAFILFIFCSYLGQAIK
jgi:hypothetical protein